MAIGVSHMARNYQAIAMELALLAAGHRFPRLSQVGAAWGDDTGGPTAVEVNPPVEAPVSSDIVSDGFSFFILDVTLTHQGKIVLIEANGSNAALTSSVLGKDDKRARHMYNSYLNKKKLKGSVVALLPYQKGLLHVAEFFGRAGLFAEFVSAEFLTRLCNTEENLGSETLSVVCGEIADIAKDCSRNGNELLYKNRPVVFATNPNLLPELARGGVIRTTDGVHYNMPTPFFHEGRCTRVVHDRALQQDLAEGTNITPLSYEVANTLADCLPAVRRLHKKGHVAVGKMNAGSGGAGIEFFPPELSDDEITTNLGTIVNSATTKYGAAAMLTMFPMRFFEFARSTDYELYGAGHIWDLRLQCLISPGRVEITPCVIRICSEPFDGRTYSRESVVSNLTGRDPATLGRFMRSPAAHRRSQPSTVLESIGIEEEIMKRILDGCAQWCEAAWTASSRSQ
jgi:hypothetical protein